MSDNPASAPSPGLLKTSLAAAVAVVVFVFAAFGSFLVEIAPPKVAEAPGQSFALGLASFIALILLLLIQHIIALWPAARLARLIWLVAAAVAGITFMWIALSYRADYAATTFEHTKMTGGEPRRYLMGDEFTERGRRFDSANVNSGPDDLMTQAGVDDPNVIWTRSSILNAETRLVRQYQLLIIALCIALFSLGSLVPWRFRKRAGK